MHSKNLKKKTRKKPVIDERIAKIFAVIAVVVLLVYALSFLGVSLPALEKTAFAVQDTGNKAVAWLFAQAEASYREQTHTGLGEGRDNVVGPEELEKRFRSPSSALVSSTEPPAEDFGLTIPGLAIAILLIIGSMYYFLKQPKAY